MEGKIKSQLEHLHGNQRTGGVHFWPIEIWNWSELSIDLHSSFIRLIPLFNCITAVFTILSKGWNCVGVISTNEDRKEQVQCFSREGMCLEMSDLVVNCRRERGSVGAVSGSSGAVGVLGQRGWGKKVEELRSVHMKWVSA